MRVDQIIPTLASRDAIGVHTLALTEALRQAGIESDIFFGDATPDVADQGRPVSELGRFRRGRWLLYQASIGHHVFDLVAEREEPKLVNYHNITPAELLEEWEPSVGYVLRLGRAQLRRLAPMTSLAIAVSRFNQSELEQMGYRSTAIAPLLVDMNRSGVEADPDRRDHLGKERARGGTDLLFVGKVSPHKAPHDLVAMLAVYRELFDPLARLHLVGRPLSSRYETALLDYVDLLGLTGAVHMVGSVTDAELEAYYRCCDVFVCASEHEGFCAPLVEAMGHGLPVVAYGSSAVPETVAGAGLVLPDKDPLRFATAAHRVVRDQPLRRAMARAGQQRSSAFEVGSARRRMVDLVRGTVTGGTP